MNNKLIINKDVKNIIDGAYSNKKLDYVSIPSNISTIGNFSFIDCDLLKLNLDNGIKYIGKNAFSYNHIKELIIPSSVDIIDDYAFRNNSLNNLTILNGVKKIGNNVFYNNKLKCVYIPLSVKEIGRNAFDNIDIIYNGVKIDKEIISKYGTENIIKLNYFIKYSNSDIIKKLPYELIVESPLDKDSIKGIIRNYKFYLNIRNYIKKLNRNINSNNIFKICYILGLFKDSSNININFIKCFINKMCDDNKNINEYLAELKLTNYKIKVKETLKNFYFNDELNYKNKPIIKEVYELYKDINNSCNNINYMNVCKYIDNSKFKLKDGNIMLKPFLKELSSYFNQEEFDSIQNLYSKGLSNKKSLPISKDDSNSLIRYYWVREDSPINIILGYRLNTCAKLNGVGYDIMKQSIINPDIINLILLDENNKIIGKLTAYYNKDKKYILFNNATVKGIKTKNFKLQKEREDDIINAIKRAVNDMVLNLKKEDIVIKDVRMGMSRNNLEDIIKKNNIKIEHYNLLSNYNYENYLGDANDIEGQAILYSDLDSENIKYSIDKTKKM